MTTTGSPPLGHDRSPAVARPARCVRLLVGRFGLRLLEVVDVAVDHQVEPAPGCRPVDGERTVAERRAAVDAEQLLLGERLQQEAERHDHRLVGEHPHPLARPVGADVGEHAANPEHDVGPALPTRRAVVELAHGRTAGRLLGVGVLDPPARHPVEQAQVALAQPLVEHRPRGTVPAVQGVLHRARRAHVGGTQHDLGTLVGRQPGEMASERPGLLDPVVGQRCVRVPVVEVEPRQPPLARPPRRRGCPCSPRAARAPARRAGRAPCSGPDVRRSSHAPPRFPYPSGMRTTLRAAPQWRGSALDGIWCTANRFEGACRGRAVAMNSAPLPWSFSAWGDETLVGPARDVAADVDGSLALARTHDEAARSMGHDTWRLFSALATLGSVDLTTARAVEPHWDAVAILDQAGVRHPETRPGASTRRRPRAPASRRRRRPTARWQLSGTKPWCSLADRVSHALVTASVEGSPPGLFAVALDRPGVAVDAGAWVPRGLRDITTSTVTFDDVPADPVGDPGWYLERPGFAWGGIGVAAVWFGAAAAVAGVLWDAARSRPPDQVALMHLGCVRPRPAHHPALAARCRHADRLRGRPTGRPGRCSRAGCAPRPPGAPRRCSPRSATRSGRDRWRSTRCTPPGSPTSRSTFASTTPSATWPRSAAWSHPMPPSGPVGHRDARPRRRSTTPTREPRRAPGSPTNAGTTSPCWTSRPWRVATAGSWSSPRIPMTRPSGSAG